MFWGYHAEQEEEFWCAWVKKGGEKYQDFRHHRK